MKFIDEIIEMLTSRDPDLLNALFKAKLLFHKIHSGDAKSWVDSEINGYKDDKNIPDYRILDITIQGNCSNSAYRYQGQVLPTYHLDKGVKDNLEKMFLSQSISVIESYAKNDSMQRVIAPEFYPLLSKGLGNGFQIETAWGSPSAGSMLQVVTEVRSRLLDFLLQLSDDIPDDVEEDVALEQAKELDTKSIYQTFILKDSTLYMGDDHSHKVITYNLESLKNSLSSYKVPEEDILELESAIKNDGAAPELQKSGFGENVKNWLSKMVNKAGTTAWDISKNTAETILSEAIKSYYGF